MSDLASAAQAFFDHLAAVSWSALAIALLVYLARTAAATRAWRNIIAAAYPAAPVSWRGIFGAYAAGGAVGAVVPARGGDLLRLFLARRQVSGSSYATLAATILVQSAFDFAVGIALFLAAVRLGVLPGLAIPPDQRATGWILAHPGETAVGGLVMLTASCVLAVRVRHRALALRRRVAQGFAVLGDWRLYLRRVVAWQALDWALRLVILYWFLRAFGLAPSLENAFAVQVAQNASALLPFTPSGIGTEQALTVYVLPGAGPTTDVLGFSVGMKLALVGANVLLGFAALALMLRTLRWRRALAAEPELAEARRSGWMRPGLSELDRSPED